MQGNRWVAKEDMHRPLFQDCSSSSTILYILIVAPLVSLSLSLSLSRSAAVACVYSARESREGPEKGQCRLSERLSTPRLSKEVCMGASQHRFPKLHIHPPLSFIHRLAYLTGMRTQTTSQSLLLSVSPSLSRCLTFPTNPSQ